MKVPDRSAAAMSSSPLWARAGRPSRVNSTGGASGMAVAGVAAGVALAVATAAAEEEGGSAIGARTLFDVDEELVTEQLDARADRRGDRGPEHADGRLLGGPGQPGRDVVARVEQEIEVLLATVPGLDALQDPLQPARALAAWRALAAGLAREELGDPPRG